MPNLPELVNNPATPKFLMSSEKAARATVAGGAAIVAGAALYKALPYVIHFAEMGIEAGLKMIVFGAVMAVWGLILMLVLNKSVQTSVWYWYMGLVDAIAFRIVKVNPVARVKAYVGHYLEPMGEKAADLLARASGRLKSAQRRVDENNQLLKAAEDRAQYCLSHGSTNGAWTDSALRTEFSVQSSKVTTLRGAIKRLDKRLIFQKGCVEVLRSLQDVISAYTEVTRFNVDMMVEEFESAGEMAEGSKEVSGMLGNSKTTQFYNLAAADILQQTDHMMSEVEGVMTAVQKQLNSGKIDDAIGEENLIRELTGKVGNMSAFAENQRMLTQNGEAAILNKAKANVSATETGGFGSLLPPK